MQNTSADGTHFVYRFLTPRNLLCLLTGFGLYTGLKYHNPQLIFLGVFCLTAMVTSIIRSWRFFPELRIKRQHTNRTFEHQTVPVTVELENRKKAGPALILIEDYFPAASSTRFRHLIMSNLKSNERVQMTYRANCNSRRGLYTNGPLRLECFDPLGIMKRVVHFDHFTDILLYPNTVDLKLFKVLGDGTLRHVGFERLMRPGESAEFIGLRPYVAGDSLNRIHWRTSARTQEFRVKEFQESIVTDVTIFLDLGRLGLTGLGEQTSLEYAIKSAGTVARTAIEKGHMVQLIMIGKGIEHVPLGTGKNHLLMILDRLSFAKAEHDSHFQDNLILQIPYLRRGGTAVLIQSITTIEHESMDQIVGAMQLRQIMPIMIGVDDRAFIKLYREQEEKHGTALSVEDMIKELVVRGLRMHVVSRDKQPLKGLQRGLEREEFADAG